MRWLAWPLSAFEGAHAAPPGDPVRLWWALRFTPRVAILEEAVLLEVSSTERLWGGMATLQGLLAQAAQQSAAAWSTPTIAAETRGPTLDVACEASTALQALALLRMQTAGRALPPHLPDALPLSTLTALRPHAQALRQLGCRCWGDVRGLPRAGLARRFGAAMLLALDQAYGACSHHLPWLVLPEHFDQELELPQCVHAAPALLQAAQYLLHAWQTWLVARQKGVLALQLRWRHDLRRVDGVELPAWGSLELRTAEAVQGMEHLQRLLSERLAHTTLAAPVNTLVLHSLQEADLCEATASLLPPGSGRGREHAQGEPWHQFVERVSARLGPGSVQVARLHADHRPEAMQQWQDCAASLTSTAAQSAGTDFSTRHAMGPGWLLRPPQALAVHRHRPWLHGQPLRLLAGPERVESGWWQPADNAVKEGDADHALALRDYFVAHNAIAGWVWVFRDTPTGRWFLHGRYA